MKVITGSARGRKLIPPEGLELRPSSDMTKQAVFNIIQNYVEGSSFLDLFAGSGQVGIEAASRGAKSVTFIDSSSKAILLVKENLQLCGFMEVARVSKMDSLSFVQSCPTKYDLAFLDPPYGKGLIEKALPLLSEKMEEAGIIVCETERDEELPQSAGDFHMAKTYNYGKAKLTVYKRPQEISN